jgi:hypothetical protein
MLTGAKCTGGAHRRRRFFDEVRASYRNVVTIDTGAYFWGSFFFSRFEGEASAQFFQEANYDVMGLSQVSKRKLVTPLCAALERARADLYPYSIAS